MENFEPYEIKPLWTTNYQTLADQIVDQIPSLPYVPDSEPYEIQPLNEDIPVVPGYRSNPYFIPLWIFENVVFSNHLRLSQLQPV